MTAPAVLVVMARAPVVGTVKTRLARTIGAAAACALHRAFLADLDARFANGPWPLVWAYHPPQFDFPRVVRPDAFCVPQEGSDLGERMLNAVRRFCDGGTRRVLIVGADVPHLRVEWVAEAEAALADVDLVVGPSRDGGYYLIGMQRPCDVFRGVAMGTSGVLAATRARTAALGLRTHFLPETFDVDDAADLEALRKEVAGSPELVLPATSAALATI